MQRILIVDDDTDLLEMVELALTEQGFQVSTITEGRSLLSKVESFQPHVILLDIYLDDADGRELCYQLKSNELFKHIPVALYSAGHITNSSILESKANTFISKPFNIVQLGEKIKEILTVKTPGSIPQRFMNLFRQYVPLSYFGFRSINESADISKSLVI